MDKKDTLMAALPDTVHVVLEIEEIPTHNNPWPKSDTYERYVPKKWLVHGERGSYREWTWNKRNEKAIERTIGERLYRHAHLRSVKEWNIIENITANVRSARRIGFNVFEYLGKVNEADVIYTHNIDW